jgi:predicted dienelactone hydrolase
VRAALPRQPEAHVVERACHFDFLAPCSDGMLRVAPAICTSAPGFDRTEFSRRLDTAVVGFFMQTLSP